MIKSRRLAPLIKKVRSSNLVNTSNEFRLLNISYLTLVDFCDSLMKELDCRVRSAKRCIAPYRTVDIDFSQFLGPLMMFLSGFLQDSTYNRPWLEDSSEGNKGCM